MTQLPTAPELCVTILRKKLKDDTQYHALPKELTAIFKDRKFPMASAGKIQKVKKLDVDELSVNSLCQSIHFSIKFDEKLLLLAKDSLELCPDYCALIIFYYFIAFVAKVQSCGDISHYKPMLESLQDLAQCDTFKTLQKVPGLAIFAFVHAYSAVANSPTLPLENVEEWSGLFTVMTGFLTSNLELPDFVFNMVLLTLDRVIDPRSPDLSKVGHAFLNFLSMIMSVTRMPAFVSAGIVHAIRPLIFSMDGETLRFLKRSITRLDKQEVTPIVLALPAGVSSLVDRGEIDKKLEYKGVQSASLVLPERPAIIRHEFRPHSTFSDVLVSFPPIPEFPKDDVILGAKLTAEVDVAAEVLSAIPDLKNQLIEDIMKLIKDGQTSTRAFEYVAAFLRLLARLCPFDWKYLESLCDIPMLTSEESVFSQGKTFEYINEVRQLATVIFIRQEPHEYRKICARLRRMPLLFAEYVMRVVPPQIQIKDWGENIGHHIVAMLKTMYYYQCFSDCDGATKASVNTARLSVLKMIDVFTNDNSVTERLFHMRDFLAALLPLAFENEVRILMFTFLKKYMKERTALDCNYHLRNSFREVFLVVLAMEPSETVLRFLYDAIKWMEDVIPCCERIVEEFADITPNLCRMLAKLKPSTLASQLVMETISLFSSSFDAHALSRSDIQCIETCVKNVFGSDFGTDMQLKLASLTSGARVERVGEVFIIRQPRALRLFLSLFLNSKHFLCVAEWFIKLCQFSPINAVMCHRARLDLDILSILYQARTDQTITQVQIKALFKLFFEIAKCSSSLAVIRNFVSLFSTHAGRYLSPQYPAAIECLERLMKYSCVTPSTPFTDMSVEAPNIPSTVFNDSFTLTVWLLPAEITNEDELTLISLTRALTFEIIFKQSRLIVKLGDQQQNIPYTFVQGLWKPVTLSVHVGDKIECVATVDGLIKEPIVFSKTSMGASDLKLTITGTENVWLGPVGLFPYHTPTDALQFADFASQHAINSANPHFHMFPIWSSGVVTAGVTGSCKQGWHLSHAHKGLKKSMPFVSLLNERNGLSTLLPMFAQLDMKFEDESEIPHFLDHLIWIFKQSLIYSPTSQVMFVDDGGFQIIAQLLLQSNDKHIDYKLYITLYDLLDGLIYEKGKVQLLNEILLNTELWMKADAQSHQDILRHWAQNLVPCFLPMILESGKTITTFVSMLRVYYYYEPHDKEIRCLESRARNDMDVFACRESIMLICRLIAHEQGLKDSEMEIIISHICTYSDVKQLDDLLGLISQLVHDDAVLEKTQGKLNSFHFLYFILTDGDLAEFITQKAFEIVLYLISKGMSDIGKEMDIMILTLMVSREFFTEANRCLVCSYFAEGEAALYPLVMLMATNMLPDTIGQLLEQVPCEVVVGNHYSLFWTVMSFFFVKEDIKSQITDFFSRSPAKYWTTIYGMMGIVSRLLEKEARSGREIRHDFLLKIANCVKSPIEFDIFARLSRHFMFLRSMFEKNEHLESEYKKFEADTKPRTKPAAPHPLHIPTAKSRVNKVPAAVAKGPLSPGRTAQRRESWSTHRLSVGHSRSGGTGLSGFSVIANEMFPQLSEVPMPSFNLAIRLSEKSGGWVDSDIGFLVMDLFVKFPEKQWEPLIVLIMGCLLKDDYVSPPDNLKLSDIESAPDVSAVTFYNKQARTFNKKPLSQTEMSDGDMKLNCFRYLENLNEELTTSDGTVQNTREIYQDVCVKLSAFKEQLSTKLEIEITALSGSTIKDFLNDEVSVRHVNGLRLWSRCWKLLTIEGAPWYRSLIVDKPQKKYYKRDFSACFAYASAKLRRNFAYNDHLQEALARNTGSIVTAQEQYEKKKAEIAKKYEANAPLPIFDTIDYQDETDLLGPQEVLFEGKCEVITAKRTIPATLSISVNSIFIEGSSSKFGKIISTKCIRHIFMRTHLHRPTAIEIFEFNGNSYFINFPELSSKSVLEAFNDKRIIWSRVKYVPERTRWTVQTKGFKEFFAKQPFTKQWRNRQISNFEYLMYLNIYSGRSFRNIFQYPFFPWILTDYDRPELDLTDESIFRDLSKPVGALNPNKLTDALNTYQQYLDGGMPAFMYSSAPVSPLAIYFWLVRMEPFTTLHTEMQSGKFDHTARLFLSIPMAWNLVYRQAGDFRELVPEFFFMSEFLLNNNDFDLGESDDVKANDVALPAWAKTAMEFVYLHRKALESEYVSNHLNEWIDLIWGEKQQGQKAVEAHNVFKPQLYANVWETEEGNDPMNVVEIETTLSYIGQIPPQLFDKAHPLRNAKERPAYRIDECFTFELPKPSNIISAYFEDTGTSLLLSGVCETGALISIDITFVKEKKTVFAKKGELLGRSIPVVNNPTVHAQFKDIPNMEMIYTDQEHPPPLSFVNSRALCIASNVSPSGLFLIGVEDEEITELREQRFPVTALATDGCIIASANIDSTLVVFVMDEIKCDIPSFKSRIKAIAVSDAFHMIVCLSGDGDIMFCSLTTNSFVRTVSIGSPCGKKLLITPAWGFTVVQFKKIEEGDVVFYVASYSVNGERVALERMPDKITCWHAWRSRSGFDYVVAADKNNSVFCFEAFYCKPGRRLFPTDKMKARSKIIGLYYLVAQATVVILCQDGAIFFVPYDCEENR